MLGDRIPLLSIATIQWHLFHTTLTQQLAAGIIAITTTMGIATQVTIHLLDVATAKQCRTHDWPATQHSAHMEWCATNNYPTN